MYQSNLKLVDPTFYISKCQNSDKHDIPGVYAFEIETNLRGLLEEILEPMVIINKENNKRLFHLEHVTKEIDKENATIG